MQIKKVKYKVKNIEKDIGDTQKEVYVIPCEDGFIPIRILTGSLIEGFGEIISIHDVTFNSKGKIVLSEEEITDEFKQI